MQVTIIDTPGNITNINEDIVIEFLLPFLHFYLSKLQFKTRKKSALCSVSRNYPHIPIVSTPIPGLDKHALLGSSTAPASKLTYQLTLDHAGSLEISFF